MKRYCYPPMTVGLTVHVCLVQRYVEHAHSSGDIFELEDVRLIDAGRYSLDSEGHDGGDYVRCLADH